MLPTFLGLGSARCASTWLHRILKLHPQILMTEHKEVSFFGNNCLEHGLSWYEATFQPSSDNPNPGIRGDISPWYARLSRRSVAAVHRVLPDARLILVIRNPIDRAWSHALMELALWGERPLEQISSGGFIRRCERIRQIRFGDYERILDHWLAYYPAEALFVETYDRMSGDSGGYLRDVLEHIGADPDWTPATDQLGKKHWSIGEATSGQSDKLPMPDFVRWYLAMRWLEPTRRLNLRLNGRVESWVREMEQITGRQAPLSWRMKRWLKRTLSPIQRIPYYCFDEVRELRLKHAYQRIEHEYAQKYESPASAPSQAQERAAPTMA